MGSLVSVHIILLFRYEFANSKQVWSLLHQKQHKHVWILWTDVRLMVGRLWRTSRTEKGISRNLRRKLTMSMNNLRYLIPIIPIKKYTSAAPVWSPRGDNRVQLYHNTIVLRPWLYHLQSSNVPKLGELSSIATTFDMANSRQDPTSAVEWGI